MSKRVTRRELLAKSGAAAAAVNFIGCGGTEKAGTGLPGPDLILWNGRVLTMENDLPSAQAFAVRNGRFTAVGGNDEIRSLATPSTEVIDAEGMTVTPGFIDAHSHPSGVEELTDVDVNLPSIADIQQALRKKAVDTPAGYWVRGYKYDDTKLQDGRPILRKDLDEAVPDRPVKVGHRGGHTAVYNSRAFELAGITAATPDPTGGHIYREDGQLTGKVAELAMDLLDRVGKRPEITRQTRQAGARLISEVMTAAGLTSVHLAGGDSDALTAFQDAYQAGDLRFRLYFMVLGSTPAYQGLRASGMRTGFGNEFLRLGSAKFLADGSVSERTMRMSTPFVGRPTDYGILTMSQQEIDDAVEEAHRAGFQIGIHANGDVAIDMVLSAYERVQRQWPRPDPRHRIEHCSLVNDNLLRRIKEAGVIPTPFYTYAHYHGEKWVEYGEEKLQWMFAHRSFLDYGIPVAPASDYMPGPFEPMMAIQSMVTRKDFSGRVWGPNQRITVDDALRICTVNGAYASFEENLKGSIRGGKLADFVILGRDPREVDPDRIKEIPVVRTVVGGKTVHLA